MKTLLAIVFTVALSLLLTTAGAIAQDDPDTDNDDSFLMRVNGTTTIAAGESVDVALVINGDVVVDGTVNDSLVVIKGTATINGAVGQDVTVIRGDLILNSTASVDDIMLVDSDLTRDDAATVTGSIEDRSGDFSLGRGAAVFSILFWLGFLVLAIVVAIIFAWLGRAQLFGAVETLRSQFVPSLITAIVLFIALPVVAVLILFTLVGAPLGLSILLTLIPVLLLLGLIVFGSWIASYIITSSSTAAAIGTAVLGVVLLAVISLIPFVALIVALAGMLGAGALVYRSFRRASTAALPQEA